MMWRRCSAGRRQRMGNISRSLSPDQQYNKYTGGLDTSDQMLGTNCTHRGNKRWYITVYQHFLDIAVTNSFILHKELYANQ